MRAAWTIGYERLCDCDREGEVLSLRAAVGFIVSPSSFHNLMIPVCFFVVVLGLCCGVCVLCFGCFGRCFLFVCLVCGITGLFVDCFMQI